MQVMGFYMRCVGVGIVIIAGFLWAENVFALDNKTNQPRTEAKNDSTKIKYDSTGNVTQKINKKKKKTRAHKLSNNFLFNEIVRGASFRFKSDKDRFVNEKDIGWSDYFTLSYDYTTINDYYGDLLKNERKGKEKRLLIGGYHISYKKKPFLDINYSSDGSIGLYSTILVGGLGRQFKNGLKLEGGMGLKLGNVDFKKEKYDVVNIHLGYVTLNKKSMYKLNTQVKAFLPRKYMTKDMFNGLWMVDGSTSITINKSIFGVMPAIGFTFRRDYIPVIENKVLNYEGIVRYNLTLGFTVAKGGTETLE